MLTYGDAMLYCRQRSSSLSSASSYPKESTVNAQPRFRASGCNFHVMHTLFLNISHHGNWQLLSIATDYYSLFIPRVTDTDSTRNLSRTSESRAVLRSRKVPLSLTIEDTDLLKKTKSRVLIQRFDITEVTRAPSIAVDKNYRKIYQRKPPPPNTNNSGHLTPYRQ